MAAYVGRGKLDTLPSTTSSHGVPTDSILVRCGEAEGQGWQAKVHVRERHDRYFGKVCTLSVSNSGSYVLWEELTSSRSLFMWYMWRIENVDVQALS